MSRRRIALVAQSELFREGLRQLLVDNAFRVTRQSATLEEMLTEVPDATAPELLLLSCSADYVAAATAIQRFKAIYPNAKVVVLSEHCELANVFTVLRAGASGVVQQRIEFQVLVKSLELVMLGESVLSSSLVYLYTDQLKPQSGSASLKAHNTEVNGSDNSRKFSGREMEILECLTKGDANKLIANKLNIAEPTVKVHVKAILRKIGVANRTQAAIWARRYLS